MLKNRTVISVRVLLAQMGWFSFLKIATLKIMIKVLDRNLIPTYSQFGECRIIDGFFGDKGDGYYVDVGCNQPIHYSNTWKLYLKGWSGLTLDPNPNLIRHHKKQRPRDTAAGSNS